MRFSFFLAPSHFSSGMSRPPLCSKCKQASAVEEDTWCLGCRALESAQASLRVRWWSAGHRRAAEEVALLASRQLKALKGLDSTAQSVHDSLQAKVKKLGGFESLNRSSGSRRPPEPLSPPKKEQKEERPRASTVHLKGREPPEEEESTSFEEESEESKPSRKDKCPERTTKPKVKVERPPTPPPPPEREREDAEEEEPRREKSRRREPGEKRKRTRPGHRGGKNHQKHWRSVYDPDQRYHQKLRSGDSNLPPDFEGVRYQDL